MRFHLIPRPVLCLITSILLTPLPIAAGPHPAPSLQAGFDYNELFKRYECTGTTCGWNGQLCCPAGAACYTDINNQAQCGSSSAAYGASSYVAAPSSYAAGGQWQLYTTIYTVTESEVVTSVYSTYVGAASASGSARCNYALNESPCGDLCCKGNQYCAFVGQCSAAAGDTTTDKSVVVAATAGAPIRPTSSGATVVTATVSPTETVPFLAPIATGANVTMTASQNAGGGLSGGAIAGIVIGVLIGLAILGLICFYCCLKGLFSGFLALFGLGGKKKKRRTEVEEYERHTHHSSRGGGRTWYGAAKPARVERQKDSHKGRNALGLGAGLAGLWAVLGLKRQRNKKRNDEKYSEYSYSSDYYTSASK
ncbi:hypothetical protein LTR37_017898 [Vermiconidia calcicola]|uniref:Uncharacterized protein n=1 Tax=Vermiconidia calcicola TaxID=1690605 RepID=A0ACC3MIR2_9PEZI|nr:hypothetical protein LTR37_017898 [Vermiconidia calcicola]